MALLLYLFSKKSGIVCILSLPEISRVLLANTSHASNEPKTAFPRPARTPQSPKLRPVLPAYPTNITAEK